MKAKLGSGAKFSAIAKKAASFYEKKGKTPAQAKKVGQAIAAMSGVKKYGQKKMTQMAVRGKKK